MKNIDSILNILVLGKSFYKDALLKKFLARAVSMVVFIIISGTMMGSLLVFTLYLMHNVLLQSGVDAPSALYIISIIVLVLMPALVTLTFASLRNLRNLLQLNNEQRSDVSKIIAAFKDGWISKTN